MSFCKLCGDEFDELINGGCSVSDDENHVKRGRGRPPKIRLSTIWAEVQPKTVVRVADERGDFSFVRLADEGKSATVWSPNTGMRTFSLDRVSVR